MSLPPRFRLAIRVRRCDMEVAMSEKAVVSIDVAAAEALVRWKSRFADEVAREHGSSLLNRNSQIVSRWPTIEKRRCWRFVHFDRARGWRAVHATTTGQHESESSIHVRRFQPTWTTGFDNSSSISRWRSLTRPFPAAAPKRFRIAACHVARSWRRIESGMEFESALELFGQAAVREALAVSPGATLQINGGLP